jgi:hypothetical protein
MSSGSERDPAPSVELDVARAMAIVLSPINRSMALTFKTSITAAVAQTQVTTKWARPRG